jgi:DNA polymerase (family 10)
MTKDQVAAILTEIGTLLELKGENSFRVNAYLNAARAIDQLEEDLEVLVAQNRLGTIPGIGATMTEKITTLVNTDGLPYLDELRKQIPHGLLDIMRIQGLGPKKVKALWETLKIDSLDKLREACVEGKVAKLKGFGEKTQQKILEGIEFLAQMGSRVRIDQAMALAEIIVAALREAPGIIRMEVAGSIRRRKETCKDVDIVVASDNPVPIMDRFVALPGVQQITGHGETKSSVVFSGAGVIMNVDLRVVKESHFFYTLHHFTGSKEHNVALRARAQTMGLKINEYGLFRGDDLVPCKDETDIYKTLGLDWMPPEMRELTGEIEAAQAHKLPHLIELPDVQGVFHCHTTASDGANTLEEMALATKALGLHYLGIGDHSQSLKIANGLTPERVRTQWKQIDALNKKFAGSFHIFKGTEVDILKDGSLDFDDDLLGHFDYVVASVHTDMKQGRDEMTKRIIKAIEHPAVTMLGHATGRLLLKRDAYQVDLEQVLQAAAKAGTMIEINAHPQRLDLDWVHCKRAHALGITLVINPDAHSTSDLALYRFGVDVARRGWLEKGDVFNTRGLKDVTAALLERKKKRGLGS